MEKKEWHVEELITFVRSHANELTFIAFKSSPIDNTFCRL